MRPYWSPRVPKSAVSFCSCTSLAAREASVDEITCSFALICWLSENTLASFSFNMVLKLAESAQHLALAALSRLSLVPTACWVWVFSCKAWSRILLDRALFWDYWATRLFRLKAGMPYLVCSQLFPLLPKQATRSLQTPDYIDASEVNCTWESQTFWSSQTVTAAPCNWDFWVKRLAASAATGNYRHSSVGIQPLRPIILSSALRPSHFCLELQQSLQAAYTAMEALTSLDVSYLLFSPVVMSVLTRLQRCCTACYFSTILASIAARTSASVTATVSSKITLHQQARLNGYFKAGARNQQDQQQGEATRMSLHRQQIFSLIIIVQGQVYNLSQQNGVSESVLRLSIQMKELQSHVFRRLGSFDVLTFI